MSREDPCKEEAKHQIGGEKGGKHPTVGPEWKKNGEEKEKKKVKFVDQKTCVSGADRKAGPLLEKKVTSLHLGPTNLRERDVVVFL